MAGQRGNGTLQKLAVFFKTHPNEFINGLALAPVAGSYAWRSRVAELRTKLGMDIENRQRLVDGVTVSEYCFHDPARGTQKRKAGHNQHTHPRTKARDIQDPVMPPPAPAPSNSQLGLF